MLSNLEGVERKLIKCEFFNSVTQCLRLLKRDKATTAADDRGAINVYIDDEGVYRGYRYYMMGQRSFIVTMSKKDLINWLKIELPKIR